MNILNVELGSRSYPIYIDKKIINRNEIICRHIAGNQVLIVTNTTVGPLYLDRLINSIAGKKVESLIIPDGEQYKNLEVLNTIFDKLLSGNHNRNTTLVALGGGVVGDITGFAAACYQRGVKFIQVPTTLLAQVDSSVGGKTGVNHQEGKNMIGAFHQPQCVIIDIETLDTLPDREYKAGIAEIIKYGLIGNQDFFVWLEENIENILKKENGALIKAISQSCKEKARIVATDEEESGIRAILNLGHTFGHAIEAWQQYKGVLHGEAVSIGMYIAAVFSLLNRTTEADISGKIKKLLERAGLPTAIPTGMTNEDFLNYMQKDKKANDKGLRLIALKKIGEAVIIDGVSNKLIIDTLDEVRKRNHT